MGLNSLPLDRLIRPLGDECGDTIAKELIRRGNESTAVKAQIVDRMCEFARTFRSSCHDQAVSNYRLIRAMLEAETDSNVVCRILQARQEFDWHSAGNLFHMLEGKWSSCAEQKYLPALERIASFGEYLVTRYIAISKLYHLSTVDRTQVDAALARCLDNSPLMAALISWQGYCWEDRKSAFPESASGRLGLELVLTNLHHLWGAAEGRPWEEALLVCAARTTLWDYRPEGAYMLDAEGHPVLLPSRLKPFLLGWLGYLETYASNPPLDEFSDDSEKIRAGHMARWALSTRLPDPSARTCVLAYYDENISESDERAKALGHF